MTPLFKLLACAALGVQLFLGCFGQGGGTLCLGAWACSDHARAEGPAEPCCCCCQPEGQSDGSALNSPADPCGCCVQVPPLPGGTGIADTRIGAGDDLRMFFATALGMPAAVIAPALPSCEDVWLPPPGPAGRVHVSISTTHMVI